MSGMGGDSFNDGDMMRPAAQPAKKRTADMSVQEIKEAFATRYDGWAEEEIRLVNFARNKAAVAECRTKAEAYRAVAADLRKFGGPR